MLPFSIGLSSSSSCPSIISSQAPTQKYQLASQPFQIKANGFGALFYDHRGDYYQAIGEDIALALQDQDNPETALKLLEMVFDTSSEVGLNEFIQTRNIEVQAINKTVIQRLAEKGITLTLEGEGTIKKIKMTEENLHGITVRKTLLPKALVDIITDYIGVPGEFEHSFISSMLSKCSDLPKVLVDIIIAYAPHETRITYDNVLKEIHLKAPEDIVFILVTHTRPMGKVLCSSNL